MRVLARVCIELKSRCAPRRYTFLGSVLSMLLLGARGFSQNPSLAASSNPDTLSWYERRVIVTALENSKVITRKDIILVWPAAKNPNWCLEAHVHNPQEMADWLEKVYQFCARWTKFDPNEYYATRHRDHSRLIFIHNGKRDFVYGPGKRPYIGLRDLEDPPAGSEGWFGWLCHELSHDFWREHPAFKRVKAEWGEGMCDYHRLALLRSMGLPEAAARDESRIRKSRPDDRYLGAALMLLQLQTRNGLGGPEDLWGFLWNQDFKRVLGNPKWAN